MAAYLLQEQHRAKVNRSNQTKRDLLTSPKCSGESWGLLRVVSLYDETYDRVLKIANTPENLHWPVEHIIKQLYLKKRFTNVILYRVYKVNPDLVTRSLLRSMSTARKCYIIVDGKLVTKKNWMIEKILKDNPFYSNAIERAIILNKLRKCNRRQLVELYNEWCPFEKSITVLTPRSKMISLIKKAVKQDIISFGTDLIAESTLDLE
jgi:hypothetical protein